MDATRLLRMPVSRLGAAAQNALEVARFGGLDTGEEASPFTVVAHHRVYRLRRYFHEVPVNGRAEASTRPPVLLVPPMMLAAEVYDVSPTTSAVGILHRNGADPWVVDFGAPEKEEGGLERTLADHVLAISDAVDRVREFTGRDVHLAGYSQGGMFCYQTAAYRRSDGISSVIGFGSPVDLVAGVPLGLPEEFVARAASLLADKVLARQALPAWASRTGFRLLDPVKAARQQIDFLMQLHDREALLPRERQRRFLMGEGWVAWPGPALADFTRQFLVHNRMVHGGFLIEDRLVTLADIACPVLVYVGEVDEIAPPAGVRAITRAAPRAEIYERSLRAGHFGLVVGSAASHTTWPEVAAWARWRDGDGRLPSCIIRAAPDAMPPQPPGVGARVGHGLGLATGVGAGLARTVLKTTTRTAKTLREVGVEAVEQLPRLARLEQVRPRTRISLALLLDEQAERRPGEVLFLFEDRAHTHAAAKDRIDNVVRGLLSLGIRQGEHVGVLMEMRPSALIAVAALNRIGAVSVLLRPDGAVDREAELGKATRIVADPQHAERALTAGLPVFVLGGGGEPRDLGLDVVDMERIDPDAVTLPSWYRPNPGRGRDIAFVTFTGEGERTRTNRITNRRWALSAFGTASSAALGPADTVYSVTPVYHTSALLMTLGGAIAGGARIAMARRFDPEVFWDETRRYGVTVASYTWTMLRDLVEAPPHPGEQHHPVRLFIGSGMPRNLWCRVEERFRTARVVEFYASPEGEAILVNLRGAKPGAMGRPLPGTAPVRIAEYDADTGRLVTGADGFVQPVARGEIGMLLAQVHPEQGTPFESPLRGVFSRDDAWQATGDLFRRDEDGDFWLIDPASALIRTRDALVAPGCVRDVLGDIDAVDLAVAYGVPAGPDGDCLVVGAVTLRDGRSLSARDLNNAFAASDVEARPAMVHVVDEIPVTTWFRPITGPLRRAGLPSPGKRAFYRDAAGNYRQLTAAARKRLSAG